MRILSLFIQIERTNSYFPVSVQQILLIMTSTLYFLVPLVFGFGVVQINGQGYCTPHAVLNLTISKEAVLSWEPSPNDICRISYYLIFILLGADEEIVYTNNVTLLDISFLPTCTSARFTVAAVSTQNIRSNPVSLLSTVPAPDDLELNLVSFSLAQGTNSVTLRWDVDEEWRRCGLQFRILVYNEDDNIPRDIYTRSTSETVNNLIPCTSYTFGVTPIYNIEREGHPSVIRYASPTAKIAPPTLQSFSLGSTTLDFTWTLQQATINRCVVSALIMDASPYFTVSYPIADQANRPPINVRLTGLRSDTMYWLKVSANNVAGSSDPFTIGIQTLE